HPAADRHPLGGRALGPCRFRRLAAGAAVDLHVVLHTPGADRRDHCGGRRAGQSRAADHDRPRVLRPARAPGRSRPLSDGVPHRRRTRGLVTRSRRRAAVLAAVLMALLGASVAGARADSQPDTKYADAVQHASDLLRGAAPPDTGPAVEAERALKDGTGASQPEILADLEARPPLYDD